MDPAAAHAAAGEAGFRSNGNPAARPADTTIFRSQDDLFIGADRVPHFASYLPSHEAL